MHHIFFCYFTIFWQLKAAPSLSNATSFKSWQLEAVAVKSTFNLDFTAGKIAAKITYKWTLQQKKPNLKKK